MKTQQKGFTLIELLITIAIIGTIAAIAIPTLLNYLGNSEEAAIEQNCKTAPRILKAEYAKPFTGQPAANLNVVLNDQGRSVSPADNTAAAYLLDTSTTTISAAPAPAKKGQITIAFDTALSAKNEFSKVAYQAVIGCDINADGAISAGAPETTTLQLGL